MFKQNPSNLIFFFRVKVDAPLSSRMLNFYLIKGERPSLSSHLFYEPRSIVVHSKSKWVWKGGCWPKDWQEYRDVSLLYLYGDMKTGL